MTNLNATSLQNANIAFGRQERGARVTRPNGYNKCCGTRQQPPVARGARAIPKRHGRSCEMNAHTSTSNTLGDAHANSTLALQELADGGALVALGLRQSSARPRRVEAHLQQPPELGFLGISACKTIENRRHKEVPVWTC